MKVNVGCGPVPLDGYVNVDQHTAADVKGDAFALVFEGLDEVRADHMIEHVPHRRVVDLLSRFRSWLRPGGLLRVEVPDMVEIMRNPPANWESWVYGVQEPAGEFHMSGYSAESLRARLEAAGFSDVDVRAFRSTHPNRPGMPCLEGTAVA